MDPIAPTNADAASQGAGFSFWLMQHTHCPIMTSCTALLRVFLPPPFFLEGVSIYKKKLNTPI